MSPVARRYLRICSVFIAGDLYAPLTVYVKKQQKIKEQLTPVFIIHLSH